MTRAVKETPVRTALHELKERVKRRAKMRDGTLMLTMREVIGMVETLEVEERRTPK